MMRAFYNCSQEDWFRRMWKIVFKVWIISNPNNYDEFSSQNTAETIASPWSQGNSINRSLRWNRQIFCLFTWQLITTERFASYKNAQRNLIGWTELIWLTLSLDEKWNVNPSTGLLKSVRSQNRDWLFHLWWALFVTTEKPQGKNGFMYFWVPGYPPVC